MQNQLRALRRGGPAAAGVARGRLLRAGGRPAVAPVILRYREPAPAFPKENRTSFIMSSPNRRSVPWVLNRLLTTERGQRQGVCVWRGEGGPFTENEWRARTRPARHQCTATQGPAVPWGAGQGSVPPPAAVRGGRLSGIGVNGAALAFCKPLLRARVVLTLLGLREQGVLSLCAPVASRLGQGAGAGGGGTAGRAGGAQVCALQDGGEGSTGRQGTFGSKVAAPPLMWLRRVQFLIRSGRNIVSHGVSASPGVMHAEDSAGTQLSPLGASGQAGAEPF